MSFQIIQGVELDSSLLEGVESAFVKEGQCYDSIISAELIEPLLVGGVKLLPEPHFFFIELPCTEDEEKELRHSKSDPLHCKVYYLDGCTEPVSQAIIKRWGGLLINDGLTRFGFGSNSSDEEIYVSDYQQVQIYSENARFDGLLSELGARKVKKLVTPWERFSRECGGVSMAVESEGESCCDIPEILANEGMYLAETREI